jgi:hypothetical protein
VRKAVLAVTAGAIALAAATFGASSASTAMLAAGAVRQAAETADVTSKVFYRCERVRMCDPGGCWVKRICWRNCPDAISCHPLYGAYGPYGGIGYWGAYTFTGWGPPRR